MKGILNKAVQSLALVAFISVCAPLSAKPTIADNFTEWAGQAKEACATGQKKATDAFETVKNAASDAFATAQDKVENTSIVKNFKEWSTLAKEKTLNALTDAKDALVDSKLGQFVAKHPTATKVTAGVTAIAAVGLAAYKSGLAKKVAKKAKKHKRKVIVATATVSALALGLLAYNKADALKDFASSIVSKINSKETPVTDSKDCTLVTDSKDCTFLLW